MIIELEQRYFLPALSADAIRRTSMRFSFAFLEARRDRDYYASCDHDTGMYIPVTIVLLSFTVSL